MRVFKYDLIVTDRQTIALPRGAKILSVQMQKEYGTNQSHLQLWAEVDKENALEKRDIAIFGTGHEIPAHESLLYLSTVLSNDGQLVWHIYERVAAPKSDKPALGSEAWA